MSIGVGSEYLGVPIPGVLEVAALEVINDPRSRSNVEPTSIPFVFNTFSDREELLRFIEFDLAQTSKTNGFERHAEQDEFANGMWAGYEFVVGNVEYLHYLRSRQPNFYTYSAALLQREVIIETPTIALLNEGILQRLRDVRLGRVFVEPSSHTITNSSDHARVDAENYFWQSPDLAELYNNLLEQYKNMQLHPTQHDQSTIHGIVAYAAGFKHAASQAIEIYVQLQEELVGRRVPRFKLPL